MSLFLPEKIDSREYVFPIVSMMMTEGVGQVETIKFLGTAFFVSKKGDAVTAAHVIPTALEAGRKLAAVLLIDGKEQLYSLGDCMYWQDFDFALIKVLAPSTKYFQTSTQPIYMGTDVKIMGISEHTTTGDRTKQMRMLKGYIVTMSDTRLELNFAVPAGMSGSPVLLNDMVVGYATGRVRSEEVEDYYEEIEVVDNSRERLTITKSQRVTYYGVAHPFSAIMNVPLAPLENRTLAQFLSQQNL